MKNRLKDLILEFIINNKSISILINTDLQGGPLITVRIDGEEKGEKYNWNAKKGEHEKVKLGSSSELEFVELFNDWTEKLYEFFDREEILAGQYYIFIGQVGDRQVFKIEVPVEGEWDEDEDEEYFEEWIYDLEEIVNI